MSTCECSYDENCCNCAQCWSTTGNSIIKCCFCIRTHIIACYKYPIKCVCIKTSRIQQEGKKPETKKLGGNACTIKPIKLILFLGLIALITYGDYHLIGWIYRDINEPNQVSCSSQCCNRDDGMVCLQSIQYVNDNKITYYGTYNADENCLRNYRKYTNKYEMCYLNSTAPSNKNLTYKTQACCARSTCPECDKTCCSDTCLCTCDQGWAVFGAIFITSLIVICIIFSFFLTITYDKYQMPNRDVELV